MDLNDFKQTVWDYYHAHGRDLPWRRTAEPYQILVSEIMLQQTQVSRVAPKFERFIEELPMMEALAAAPFSLVLELWHGLGYNRRAKYLHDAAKLLVGRPQPWSLTDLKLKGIGPNTAAAICTYAYNQPHVFIETNIRSVFLHHFFPDQTDVSDVEIGPFVAATLDQSNPREWYWALMDYGSHLKQVAPNPSRASRHHTTQSRFEGSRRQVRGQVLRILLDRPTFTTTALGGLIKDQRLREVLVDLTREGLVVREGRRLRLPE